MRTGENKLVYIATLDRQERSWRPCPAESYNSGIVSVDNPSHETGDPIHREGSVASGCCGQGSAGAEL